LGLSTVFGIVKQSNGGLSVESSPAKGAEFRIYLPQRRGETKPLSLRRPELRPKGDAETILLVEDDEQVRSVIKRALGKKGYKVIEASDGGTAVAAYEKNVSSVDLIITDLVIPGFDGVTIASE